MKIELICRHCGRKRFIHRASRFKIGRSFFKKSLVGISREGYSETYECKKCGKDIDIKYEE